MRITLRKACIHTAIGAVIVVVVAVWLSTASDAISPRVFQRLRIGMDEDEVEAAIGLPPGGYVSGGRKHRSPLSGPFAGTPRVQDGLPWKALPKRADGVATDGRYVTVKYWWGDRDLIAVAYDEDGKAAGIYLSDIHSGEPGLFDRLRWLLP